MDFRVLGPIEVVDGERSLDLGGRKQRSVLAMLVLHAGRVVSSGTLVDGLWGDAPPATAAKALQVYVSRLRKVVGEDLIVTRAPGYALDVALDAIDAAHAEALVEQARGESPAEAASTLRTALALWRGPPLGDLADEPFAQAEIRRLDELRQSALEDRIDADLALGRHVALVPELEALSRTHSYRERLTGQRMLALYRSGRQAEALEVYRAARAELADELGIEPGRELRDLERRILEQDHSLAPPPSEPASATADTRSIRIRRGVALVGAVLVAAAATVAGLALATGADESPLVAAPNSVAVIDPSRNEVVSVVPLSERPTRIALHGDHVWVLYPDRNEIAHLSSSGPRLLGTVGVGGSPSGIVADVRGVWVADARSGRVTLIEPERLTVTTTIETRRHPIRGPYSDAGQVAVGFGSVWVASGNRTITRVDRRTGRLGGRIHGVETDAGNGGITTGGGAVWVAGPLQESPLARIDPATDQVTARIFVPKFRGSGVAFGGGAVWISDVGGDQIWRVDPARNIAVGTTHVGLAPIGIAFGHGSIWVANSGDGTVSRVDPISGRVVRTFAVGGSPNGIAVADDGVWVTVG